MTETYAAQAEHRLNRALEWNAGDRSGDGMVGTGLATLAIAERLEALSGAVSTARATDRSRILAAELTGVRAELSRVDAKCATLVGLAGAGLAFALATTGGTVSPAERVLVGGAAIALAASALVLLLQVLRPRLDRGGFCRWSGMNVDDVVAAVTDVDEDHHTAGELVVLSGIARRKFRAVRWGVDLLAGGLVLLAAAILTGVIW